MKIKLIDFGGRKPFRKNYNDAGADLYANETRCIASGETKKIKLGVGVKIPDGYVAQIVPRSGMSTRGVFCITGTIDSGYTGEMAAVIYNSSGDMYVVNKGDRIAQLVVYPIALPDFEFNFDYDERGDKGFGSSGV